MPGAENLLRETWVDADPYELRLLLDKHIGGPGQYDIELGHLNKLYIPRGGSDCRIELTFGEEKIIGIEPGMAFDPKDWKRVSEQIENSIFDGLPKIGREYSFSGSRVVGSWRGDRSGVQILPPPEGAPLAPYEMAEHPFILEFPVKESDHWPLTNYRRMREHRNLTYLLNILLANRAAFQSQQSRSFWAYILRNGSDPEVTWAHEGYFAPLGGVVIAELSQPASDKLEEVPPNQYYKHFGLIVGKGMCIPTDLDESILQYQHLSAERKTKFDRATFWMDKSYRQWSISMSASFASVVSAVEALTDRGSTHRVYCDQCKRDCSHESPGATERFRDFFERFAPGASLKRRRSEMYSLRSGILHGSDLMQRDQHRDFGWDPPGWNERELDSELRALTRLAMRNWLVSQR